VKGPDGKPVSDATVRLPLDEHDMALARARLDELDPEDRLLWLLLATTGMRLSEAFHIREEFQELGQRYVIVGSKTDQSQRRVPLPEAALPYLPAKIRGPQFTSKPADTSKRLNRFLRRSGITSPDPSTGEERKVLHSLRHRAKDRLRAMGCPLDIQYELLGHEERTVAAGYGRGHPVATLRLWADRIGF
jgi:integrase